MKDPSCCSQHTSGNSQTLEFQFQGTPCSLEFSKSTVCACACTQVCTCVCGSKRSTSPFFPPQVPSTLKFWDKKFLWPSAYPNRQEWLTSKWERFFHLCLPRLRNVVSHYHIQIYKNIIFFLNGIHFHSSFSSLDPFSYPPSNYSYVPSLSS